MERKVIKAINFDLDTNALKEHYTKSTGKPYNNAYYEIKSFMNKNGFEHRQGSGYVSVSKINSADIYDTIQNLSTKYNWLHKCVTRFDVTDVKKQYDLLDRIKEFSTPESSATNEIEIDDDILDLTDEDELGLSR